MGTVRGVVCAATAVMAIVSASASLAARDAGAKDNPLTQPVALAYADAFGEPGVPRLVHGATWALGSPTLSVTVIDSGEGLVLIDAGLAQWAPQIAAELAMIGHDIRDVRYILSSEPHYDHASGIAALVRASGAQVVASAAGAVVLRAGHSERNDPQLDELFAYPPVASVRTIADGETIVLGDLVVTAHATPGHTPGSMSWSWRSCARPQGVPTCETIVAAASLTSRTDGTFRFSAPANAAALFAFREGLGRLAELDCDRVIAGHPAHAQASGATGAEPCRRLAGFYARALDAQLAAESGRESGVN